MYFLLVHRDFSVGKTIDLFKHKKNYSNTYTLSQKISYRDEGTPDKIHSFDLPSFNGVVSKKIDPEENEYYNTLTLNDFSYRGSERQLYVSPLHKYDVSDFNGDNLCRTLKYYDTEKNVNFK